MIVRLALLALVVLLVLRLASRWRRVADTLGKAPRIEAARKCPDCGTYLVAGHPEHTCKPAK
jgi:hypothetical protein